jgi:hypothetical protein
LSFIWAYRHGGYIFGIWGMAAIYLKPVKRGRRQFFRLIEAAELTFTASGSLVAFLHWKKISRQEILYVWPSDIIMAF